MKLPASIPFTRIIASLPSRRVGILTSNSHANRAYALALKFFDDIIMFKSKEKFSLNEENPRGEIKVSSVCDDFGVKGYVRIAYCVSKERIQKSLPYFKKLAEEYNK